MKTVKYALLGLVGVIGMLVSMFGPVKVPFAESLAKSYYRYALGAVVFILLLILLLIGLFLFTFNANNFKSEIIQFVKERTQRELVLQGDIKVTFFPKLGLDSGKLSLSQRNSAKEFASISNARLYIAWLPLFKRQLVFDRVEINGIHANVVRLKDGTTNFDDLLISDEHLAPMTFDVDSIRITDSSIKWQDEREAQRLALHDLKLETGHLADKAPSNLTASFRLDSENAHLDSTVQLKSRIFFDRTAGRYEFADLEGKLEGKAWQFSNLVLDFKASIDSYPAQNFFTIDDLLVSATLKYGQRSIDAKLGAPSLKFIGDSFSGTQLTLEAKSSKLNDTSIAVIQIPAFKSANRIFGAAEVTADFDINEGGRTFNGKLTTPLSLNFQAAPKIQLSTISLSFICNHPVLSGGVSAYTKGSLLVDYEAQNAKLVFDAKVDESKFKGFIALKGFSHPTYTTEFIANRLDLDRYLSAEWMNGLFDDATVFNTAVFKDIVLQGNFRAGEIALYKFKASNLVADVNINQSMISISPLTARLYGGSSSGSVGITAHETPTISLKQNIKGLQVGAILSKTSFAGRLGGKGSIDFDFISKGNSVLALRTALSGHSSIVISHGYIAGANLISSLIEGKADLGTNNFERSFPAKFADLTDFSELRAVFDINENKVRGSGIEIKSPLIRTTGLGEFNMITGNIDLLLNATVSSAINRRTSLELYDLKGVTVPVHISGSYVSPSIAFDFAAARGVINAKPTAAPVDTVQPIRKNSKRTATTKSKPRIPPP